jgi:hypothetical protein
MSEVMTAQSRSSDFRRNLLTQASAIALVGYLGAQTGASAASEDDSRPTVWIEVGSQFERMEDAQAMFAPTFVGQASAVDQGVMIDAQRAPPYSIGGESKITFAPEATDWVFFASVRYGRSNSAKHLHHETAGLPTQIWTFSGKPFVTVHPAIRVFGDDQANSEATNAVFDFQAGKDVGLGMFGAKGSSVVSAGVRFAQFTSRSDVTLHARPLYNVTKKSSPGKYRVYHNANAHYTAVFHDQRNAHAVGPAVSWDASLPVTGSDNNTTLAFDWGLNAAVLFGRQHTRTQHQTGGAYRTGFLYGYMVHSYASPPVDHDRSRTVMIPNLGGFAGASLKFPNAKISLGYRADLFFGAMDGGIDTAKKENVGFYGPFATISIGLGG